MTAIDSSKQLIFRDEESHFQANIQAVKVLGGTLISGDTNGLLNVFRVNSDGVTKIATHENQKHPINNLDYDGNVILTGSRNTIKLMTVDNNNVNVNKPIRTGYVSFCCLFYPFAATTGLKYNRGIKIWNLETGKIFKTLLEDFEFWSMDLRNGVLAAGMSASNNIR